MSLRAKEVELDEGFIERVQKNLLPTVDVSQPLSAYGLDAANLLSLFQSQVTSRHIDYQARLLRADGKSFYTIGSAGHEGNAAVAKAFRVDDMAFLHYRSGAFFIERAKQKPGTTPIYDMLLGVTAAADDPISHGRHKVFGSLPLNIPPQTSTIASHLPKAVGAAFGVAKAFQAKTKTSTKKDSVVLCSFGDASFNHSTAQGAINTASLMAYQNIPVPIVFVCEDNGLGISVPTPDNYIQETMRAKRAMEYMVCDGRDVREVYQTAQKAQAWARKHRAPVFLHVKTVRLMGHAGSDFEGHYRTRQEITTAEKNDPLCFTAALLREYKLLDKEALVAFYQTIKAQVAAVAQQVASRPRLTSRADIMSDVIPQKINSTWPSLLSDGPHAVPEAPKAKKMPREACFSLADRKLMGKPQHMAKLINWALADIMRENHEALIFGEDVAQKGGVYHVTANLWKSFGGHRVFNSPLDEQSILGTAIGLAHLGFVPIPEIQFLAYLHNAEDQLRGEAATLPFFSSSQFTNPMVIRIASLAYQKGFGGHFHNDNALGVLRDIPGLILACPSNGQDAVLMLRTLFHEAKHHRRVGVFLEPIALYMTKHLLNDDGQWQFDYPNTNERAVLGEANLIGDGEDILLISYGNGAYLCQQAMHDLQFEHHIGATLIDLRWLAPMDTTAITHFASQFSHVLIVDECRKTGSISEEVTSLIVESVNPVPSIMRHTAEDCFIPLGPASELLLPSRKSITKAALALLAGESLEEVA